jgi:DNA-binding MarR family transcriptional regulator
MNQKPRKPTAADLETMSILHSGYSRLGDISAALGLSSSAIDDRLERLRGKGLAETIKGGRDWRITPEGMAALENAAKNPPPESLVKLSQELPEDSDTPSSPSSDEPKPPNWEGLQALTGWSNLMEVLPLPEFRAALRLVLAVALLRNRAPKLSPMPWVGLYGATGTGKSTVALCARAIVGGHFFQVGTMTTGETQGRRSSKPPYSLESAPRTLAGAVTDLDELAEAPESLRTALYALMQRTDGYVTIEGQELENRAAIVATWNPKDKPVPLPVGALRRGLLLDTTPFKRRLEKAFSLEMIGVSIRATLEQHPEPWLNIQDIPGPVPIVDKTALEQAHRTLYSILKNPSDHPLPALAGLGAAYAVLFCLSEDSALKQATDDMAALAATRGETISTWRETLQAQHGSTPESSELEETQTDTAAVARFDLELRARQAHTVQRAATPRDQLRKHFNHLAPNERELAAPILAKLEKIGQGAANANLDILEVYILELDSLEQQAVNLAHVAES